MSRTPAELGRALPRRLGILRECVRTPGDAWLMARVAGWRLVLPVLKFALPLPRLVALMWSRARASDRRPEREEQIVTMVRWWFRSGRGPRWDNCLERSLLAYRFLSEVNADPRLVVGVRKEADSVLGHAWVTVDDRPLRESDAALASYVPMTSFGPSGTRTATQA